MEKLSFDLNVRKESSGSNEAAQYGGNPMSVSFKIHHGGCFTPIPSRSYVGGQVSYIDVVDIDESCLHDLKEMIVKLGYGVVDLIYGWLTVNSDGRDAFVFLKKHVRSAVEGSSLKCDGGKRKGLKAENGKFSGHEVCLRSMGPFCTCEMVSKEEFNTCAFFNPTIIQGRVCDQESNFAIKHILANVEAHKEKEIFLAPYLQDSHWVLFLICPKTWTGYIFDSYKRDKKKTSISFYLSNKVERAFDNSFKWTMLECNQQVALWECGYYVTKLVFETLYIKQKTFPDELHDSIRALRKDELDGLIINAGSKFIQEYCNDD
ncbi:ulp1 protease family, C-terminal catalytic domain-containing protein [Tanacetum coccineum]